MIRFIFFCMAIIALSFVAVPVFTGISKERDAILNTSDESIQAAQSDELSFEEIYEIAGAKSEPTAENLNNIVPAAGNFTRDEFSSGFSGQINSALENTAPVIAPTSTEETTAN